MGWLQCNKRINIKVGILDKTTFKSVKFKQELNAKNPNDINKAKPKFFRISRLKRRREKFRKWI